MAFAAMAVVFTQHYEDAWAQIFDTGDGQKTIRIGVISTQTLDPQRPSSDDDRLRAMELARDDFLKVSGSYDLELVDLRIPRENFGEHADNRAGAKIKEAFESYGITYFVGPMGSTDAASAIAQFEQLESANPEADFAAISPISTAPSLGMDDGMFRMIADDTQQTIKIADLLQSDGKTHVITVGLAEPDAWLRGLEAGFKTNFAGETAFHITTGTHDSRQPMVLDSLTYDLLAAGLDARVSNMTDKYGADRVAIVVMLYSTQLSQLVQAAQRNSSLEGLDDVAWYGFDGIATSRSLVGEDNASVGEFLADVMFTATQYAGDDNPTRADVRSRLVDLGVLSIDSVYTYASYDAAFLLASAIAERDRDGTKTVRTLLHELADDPAVGVGALGDYSFNANGDLDAPLTYAMWRVALDENSIPFWVEEPQQPLPSSILQMCR